MSTVWQMFSEFLKLHVSFQFCPADFYRENTLQLRGTFPALDNFKGAQYAKYYSCACTGDCKQGFFC